MSTQEITELIYDAEIKAKSLPFGIVIFYSLVYLKGVKIRTYYKTVPCGFLHMNEKPGDISHFDLMYFTGNINNPWETINCLDYQTLIRMYNKVKNEANILWNKYGD